MVVLNYTLLYGRILPLKQFMEICFPSPFEFPREWWMLDFISLMQPSPLKEEYNYMKSEIEEKYPHLFPLFDRIVIMSLPHDQTRFYCQQNLTLKNDDWLVAVGVLMENESLSPLVSDFNPGLYRDRYFRHQEMLKEMIIGLNWMETMRASEVNELCTLILNFSLEEKSGLFLYDYLNFLQRLHSLFEVSGESKKILSLFDFPQKLLIANDCSCCT